MIANQRLINRKGTQVLLFPLSYMNISQGEEEEYSHKGILAIDFLGWGENGRVLKCPYYAPCDIQKVYSQEDMVIWESLKPVLLANNEEDFVTILVAHDDTQPSINRIYQGGIMGHTGIKGQVTGDHVHMNVAKGKYQGLESIEGAYQLKNSIHIYDAMFINNTILINDYNYPWKTFTDRPGYIIKKGKFPWVLYVRKLNKKRKLTIK